MTHTGYGKLTARLKGSVGKKASKHKFKPFRAKDAPHRDYRGEKVVNGTKWRV